MYLQNQNTQTWKKNTKIKMQTTDKTLKKKKKKKKM
jgi:hypothetical protein